MKNLFLTAALLLSCASISNAECNPEPKWEQEEDFEVDGGVIQSAACISTNKNYVNGKELNGIIEIVKIGNTVLVTISMQAPGYSRDIKTMNASATKIYYDFGDGNFRTNQCCVTHNNGAVITDFLSILKNCGRNLRIKFPTVDGYQIYNFDNSGLSSIKFD